MSVLATNPVDALSSTLLPAYYQFQEYAKASILYFAAAGLMIQVIKSMRS